MRRTKAIKDLKAWANTYEGQQAIYKVWAEVDDALLATLGNQDPRALAYLAEYSDFSSAFKELCGRAIEGEEPES